MVTSFTFCHAVHISLWPNLTHDTPWSTLWNHNLTECACHTLHGYFCLELFYEILSAKVDTAILSRHIIHILPFIVAIICCICNYYTIPILLYYTYTVFHYFRSLYLWSSPVKYVICSGVRLLLDAKLWVFETVEQLTHN